MSNYNSQLQSNNLDLQNVLQTLQNKAAGGEQATPVISVNSANGLITATAGTKSSTHQLAFQPAKTITPSTASQIAVSSGYYTGGNITVAGDSNLVAGNIKKGVDIFGVTGTLEEGGTSSGEQVEWSANEDAMITGTLSSYFNDRVETIGNSVFNNHINLQTVSFPVCKTIGSHAFSGCWGLTTISFPVCKTIENGAFHECTWLKTANFPACTSINSGAFRKCWGLTTISFPVCKTIGSYAFYCCDELTTVSFPVCTNISVYAFSDCYNFKSLYLTGSSLCALSNSNAFTSTPIGGYSASAGTYGSIYVPASLLTSYQTATNWTYFSSRFVAYNPIITFTIDGTEYQAEEGMTWAEWVESEYDIDDRFFMNNGLVCLNQESHTPMYVSYNNEAILGNNEIIQDTVYITLGVGALN